jgi:subtilase family serine protease
MKETLGIVFRMYAILIATAAIAACGQNVGEPINPPTLSVESPATEGAPHWMGHARRVCDDPRPGFANCLAMIRTDIYPENRPTPSGGYGPQDLQSAYRLPSSHMGKGQAIAIVDAYSDPSVEVDLGKYRSYYHLPACTASNGCFKRLNQSGDPGPYPPIDQNWSIEQSLDVDVASAICPKCHLILVEANSSTIGDLSASEDTAAATGTSIISNSFGIAGQGEQYASDFDHPGVIITVAAGDAGYGVYFPAELNTVVAVGGTTLIKGGGPRGWSETVWPGTGSGCSLQRKPKWQHDKGCPFRTETDVAADADPNTGVVAFCKCVGGWYVVGGTSVAAPLIASVYALAGNASSLKAARSLYVDPQKTLYDITSGSNGKCIPKYLCNGEKGYDGPTGNGTPNGTGAF